MRNALHACVHGFQGIRSRRDEGGVPSSTTVHRLCQSVECKGEPSFQRILATLFTNTCNDPAERPFLLAGVFVWTGLL